MEKTTTQSFSVKSCVKIELLGKGARGNGANSSTLPHEKHFLHHTRPTMNSVFL